MKFKFLLMLIVFVGLVFSQDQPKHKFVGSKKCGMCHKSQKAGEQLKLWKEKKHSKAFEALKSEKGKKLAESKGLGNATEAKECLTCHAPGLLVDKKFHAKGFVPEEGVQCETCHGAGQKYKSMKIMKDHAKSVANGMVEFKDEAAIKALCVTCHNGNEHTGKFDFTKAWKKVAHPTPKKK